MNLQQLYILEKRISNLERKINEDKQVGEIYHVCSLDDYLNYIVPEDTLKSSGKWKNHLYGGKNFVSFTRNKGYIVPLHDEDNALIQLVVDGDELSHHRKIKPYNNYAFTKDGKKYKGPTNPSSLEAEEAVEGPIEKISDFIKEVRIDFIDNTNDISFINTLKNNMDKLRNVKYYNFAGKSGANIGAKNGEPLEKVIGKLVSHINNCNLLYSTNKDKIKSAIESGVNVNRKYGSYDFPITRYCSDDKYSDIVKMLLDAGADPNTVDISGDPIICSASGSWCDKIVSLLIKSGANVNVNDSLGDSVLARAVKSGDDTIVKMLIDAGADTNWKDKNGKTLLDLTADPDVKIIEMLTDAGVIRTVQNNSTSKGKKYKSRFRR